MLRSFLDHPLLRQARAAGERQVGRVLSPEKAGVVLQTVLAAAGEARERIDRLARAALDAAQVPSSRDLEELKRRLAEMEELLDGLSARLARAEAHEASVDDTDTDTDDEADDDDADEPAKEDHARS
jgi:hypothetical protein